MLFLKCFKNTRNDDYITSGYPQSCIYNIMGTIFQKIRFL